MIIQRGHVNESDLLIRDVWMGSTDLSKMDRWVEMIDQTGMDGWHWFIKRGQMNGTDSSNRKCIVWNTRLCSLSSILFTWFSIAYVYFLLPPEGRPGMSDVSPLSGISGMSFDSTLLSPLLFFCLVLLPFLSYHFLSAGPFFSTFPRKFFNIFIKR